MPAKKSARKAPKKSSSTRAKKTASKASTRPNAIQVRGARQHNLKGFDVDIPLGQLTVVTGPSGSGKSSLAFHTLYAEGQRRYVETFSPYVRQFFDRMDKPAVDRIDHIPPAIAIEQKNQIRTTRSTVGTLTEINDYLKLLYPRLAKGYHPRTGEEISPDTPASAAAWTLEHFADEPVLVTFPVPIPAETNSEDLFPFLSAQGYLRLLLPDGTAQRTDEPNPDLDLASFRKVDVIQDRVKASSRNKSRLFEALEAALRLGKGEATVRLATPSADNSAGKVFSTSWAPLQKPTSALFTFNNPLGACPECRGFGRVIGIDLQKAVPNPSLSIADGCVKPFQGERGEECQADLERLAPEVGIELDEPFRHLTPDQQDWLLYGEGNGSTDTETLWQEGKWYGVKGFFDWMESKAYKMHVRIFLARYRSYTQCGACRGRRLRPEALAFKIADKTLPDLWRLSIEDLSTFMEKVRQETPPLVLDKTLDLIFSEITTRLDYLKQVGLSYLTLDRPARTLSGGEIARVNLTTCLGTSLSQTLFVLDEPTVGLHPRDIEALIGVMEDLRDKGNTLLVVEHDEAVMKSADNLLDIGPRSGQHGGHLVYQGPGTGSSKESITLPYLNGQKSIPLPEQRRAPKDFLELAGVNQNNLRDVSLKLPLGRFTCLTGVSGSGKSTLAHDGLFLNLARELGQESEEEPAPISRLVFPQGRIGSVQLVDQTPLAKTPKSTPAVYLGAFEAVRQLFTLTPEAKAASLKPGFFSFNSGAGRCERCLGNGFEKVEMQFLSDLYLTCPECEGKRYNQSALDYKYYDSSISDVLTFTIEEFVEWTARLLANDDDLAKKEVTLLTKAAHLLQPLIDVGLGYLRLGQPLNTLSGGESQRLKLCQLLGTSTLESQLLILDEPTTGLHFIDIERLVLIFQRLVDSGHTLLVIEHNLDVIKCADHIIDMGPGAGTHGGHIVAEGTPEEVAKTGTLTGEFLAPLLGKKRKTKSAKTPAATPRTEKAKNVISIHGARHHNLKNITLEIPRDEMVVVTGLSGSGKSTLAFDLVFAEGQRRFLDSMSPYARQFAEQLEKPDVDKISGLPPTVAIEQRVSRGGGKSTVATITELYHFLRLLFAKVGVQHCPESGLPVISQTEDTILQKLKAEAKKGPIVLLAPLIRGRKGYHTDVAAWAAKQGYTRVLVDGQFKETEGFQRLERFVEHDIDAVIFDSKEDKATAANLAAKLSEALKIGKGTCRLLTSQKKIVPLSTARVSPATGRSFDVPDPSHFSFNSPRGWCKSCRGYGHITTSRSRFDSSAFNSVSEAEIDYDRKLDKAEETELIICPDCYGTRLNEDARHVYISEEMHLSLPALANQSVLQAKDTIEALEFTGRDKLIARDILPELTQRLHFLAEVGLGYLSLDRSANTLSGGEAQRIRLAAQLGSNLRGVLYVLDEPTIGLHPRDNVKLLDTLRALQQKGNSLLIVEHDEETMDRADTQIHLGPGAGRLGGALIAATGHEHQPFLKPPRRRIPAKNSSKGWLKLKGCTHNNLKNIDAAIPLERLTVLTGVSGCGKSSLMRGTIKPAFDSLSKKSVEKTWKSISGFQNLKACYEVDQTPIGKTSRSCPATYVKLFDEIRKLFALLPEARMRGFDAGRFSFNNKEGQCPDCKGNGRIKLEMDFLPATWIDCEACEGDRYNPATLEVTYNGRNIGEVLHMTIAESAEFFSAVPKLSKTLSLLADTGLGYLQLGQPSPTLSGGEAQRIKLVSQLIKGRSPKAALSGMKIANLYLIEEPSIGLHASDVAKLIDVLHRLVEEGHTVIVIEHHMDLAAQADYIIDIGPEAGSDGGTIVAQGTPEQVANSKKSQTAPFLKSAL
ncbi:UvrABC system protein A [Roseibacillus persicicus]|uniref:UvrABC system protein A n=1 Tax=Roseibacillus persicicus TaxID=454148 RepID=A0A918TNH4_9BACT|nr:excinuclease ABC subunit UvrA [Roseibacillus persicicus]GHC54704.1 UvrABC system protein A [Roseibacillus persicicus]